MNNVPSCLTYFPLTQQTWVGQFESYGACSVTSALQYVDICSPQSISSGMLRNPPHNLNLQAREATVLLIREVLDRGIVLTEVCRFQFAVIHVLNRLLGLRRRTGIHNEI